MWPFIKQVGLYWIVLMSGIASIILMAVVALPNTSGETAGFWVASYICLIVAAIVAWVKGRHEFSEKLAELESKIRVDNPKKLERLQGLKDNIVRGKAYLERIMSPYFERPAPKSSAFGQCMTWLGEVENYLDSELPQYLKRFSDSATINESRNLDGARSIYTFRIKALEEILGHYSATQS